jgi:hypothetical protein
MISEKLIVQYKNREESQKGYMIYVGFNAIQKMKNIKVQNYINAYIANEVDKMLNKIRPIIQDKKIESDTEEIPVGHINIHLIGVVGKYMSFFATSDMYVPVASNEPDVGHTALEKNGYMFDSKTGKKIEFNDCIKDYEKFGQALIKHLRQNQGIDLSYKQFNNIKDKLVYRFDENNLSISTSIDEKAVSFDISIPFDDFGQDIFKLFD